MKPKPCYDPTSPDFYIPRYTVWRTGTDGKRKWITIPLPSIIAHYHAKGFPARLDRKDFTDP